ncbi:unnamed protein product [Protopolystoma xenopodis]|uniref:Deacetylase sirtuin-type domain-containing protein n=1 Tax=Protopolystoma xenopodis TaxID=117903 RepID=A0A3S5BTX8_9PLAT|nr:unnamed protein product [Protopolystoma xenopodis]
MESGEYPTVNQHHRRCAANSPDKSPNSKFSSSNSGAKEADAISSDECDVRGEEKWCDVAGPFRRLNALLQAGYDDPKLLLVRLFGMNASHLPNEPNCLWGLLLNLLSEPIPRRRLRGFSKIEHVVQLLSTSKRILVLTGAGVSVSCGIPDFRSRDGIYARLAKEYPELKSSQAMFDMDYFRTNPSIFFKFAKEIFPGQYSPSPAHYFIATLERLDKLLRNYTQNIDTLEQAAGVTRVIQCHGKFIGYSLVQCQTANAISISEKSPPHLIYKFIVLPREPSSKIRLKFFVF